MLYHTCVLPTHEQHPHKCLNAMSCISSSTTRSRRNRLFCVYFRHILFSPFIQVGPKMEGKETNGFEKDLNKAWLESLCKVLKRLKGYCVALRCVALRFLLFIWLLSILRFSCLPFSLFSNFLVHISSLHSRVCLSLSWKRLNA